MNLSIGFQACSTLIIYVKQLKLQIMNVLKLYRFYWKYPLKQKKFLSINYYLMYERENHITHPVYLLSSPFRTIIKHEDQVDEFILLELFKHFQTLQNIEDFTFSPTEFVLYPDYEERYRVILSNIGQGYNLGDLQINTRTNLILNCATRVMFNGYEEYHELVTMLLPRVLNLNLNGKIPSLLRADFLDIR